MPPGGRVGYSATYRAAAPRRIATIAAGYADGVFRHASAANAESGGAVAIRGKLAPIVGRVSMDLITVDVTDVGDPPPAARRLRRSRRHPSCRSKPSARPRGTIGYEVLTRLGTRFHRHLRRSRRLIAHGETQQDHLRLPELRSRVAALGRQVPRRAGSGTRSPRRRTPSPRRARGFPAAAAGASSCSRASRARTHEAPRFSTGIGELDRVTGGGIVPGSALLIGGEPGIGKSTLLLQLAATLARAGRRAVYFSGEEAAAQVRLRAERLGLSDAPVALACETSLAHILATLEAGPPPDLIVVDSIQTLWAEAIEAAPGTVSQVRAAAQALIRHAKTAGSALLLVGHVTKDGQIAGPKVIEHMVDTVLYFEGDRGHTYRILRAVKNRFGATDEIGVFEMVSEGLREVANPSELFLGDREASSPGAAVFAGIEGTRPLLVEIQALVAPSSLGTPRRAVVGWDASRLSMLLAVLEARAGLSFAGQDVYLNVAGGLENQRTRGRPRRRRRAGLLALRCGYSATQGSLRRSVAIGRHQCHAADGPASERGAEAGVSPGVAARSGGARDRRDQAESQPHRPPEGACRWRARHATDRQRSAAESR